MRIAVEHTQNEDLMQICLDEIPSKARSVRSGCRVLDPQSAAPLLDNHRLAEEIFDDIWNFERRPLGESRDKAFDVLRFTAEVDFPGEVAPDFTDDS
ncbi:hypothetical protein MesoLjLb_48360 [Mesorhizobium sp. L-8-3]|nr:hypothetical protein MesoLjLb_48360 [Mesorhizobium sp. L-8-3]